MSDKLEARRRREAEIAAIALEMTTTEAKYSGAGRSNYDIGAYKAELLANGENVEEIDDEEEEEENEEREVYTSASASSHIEASYGANSQPDMSQFRVPSIGDNEEEAEGGKVTDVDAVALERKIPLSHQVDLLGHSKAVVCLSIEPAGNRLVSGSLDYNVKMFDFGGMDTRHRPFFSIEVEDGHPVVSLAHSPSGDKFIVSTGSSQPRVYDREGKEIIKFVKGDMYLRDLANTKVDYSYVSKCILPLSAPYLGPRDGGDLRSLASL